MDIHASKDIIMLQMLTNLATAQTLTQQTAIFPFISNKNENQLHTSQTQSLPHVTKEKVTQKLFNISKAPDKRGY